MKILIAEDDEINREVIKLMLRDQPHELFFAVNGLEALQAVRSQKYDLVLMDIQMPEMDGYEATKMIRSEEKGHRIPIIAVTAYAMDSDKKKFFEAGVDDYLPKPIRTADLIQKINNFCCQS